MIEIITTVAVVSLRLVNRLDKITLTTWPTAGITSTIATR